MFHKISCPKKTLLALFNKSQKGCQSRASVLTNLIRNAKEAIRLQGQGLRSLTIRIKPHSENNDRILIQIGDSGIGIRSENLYRIFAQSFSKQGTGQGAGLRSDALAVKNLGDSLTAFSEGEGLGATFTLELPVKFQEIPT
jgi:sensor histidine kinase regulating citrate/malate metabolism